MRPLFALSLVAALAATTPAAARADAPSLERVAAFEHRPTGVAVTPDGRLTVSLPFSVYSDPNRFTLSLAVIDDNGVARPYPDASWNRRPTDVEDAEYGDIFVNLQSHTVDREGRLWVLDRGRPLGGPVVPGAAKLVQIDTETDYVVRVIPFEAEFAENNFLNDVRVDPLRDLAFVTDTSNGGVIVIELATGSQRWGLRGGNWMAYSKRPTTVQGVTVAEERRWSVPQGLALSPDGKWLYLQAHPWVAPTLYRVPIAYLADTKLSTADVEARIERVATTVYSDGIETDAQGRIYFTDVEAEGISRMDPNEPLGQVEVLVRDPRLSWPDAIGFDADGMLYTTTAQFHFLPVANEGVDRTTRPLEVFRIDQAQ